MGEDRLTYKNSLKMKITLVRSALIAINILKSNIYCLQVKPNSSANARKNVKSNPGLADSDSDDEGDIMFDPIPLYKQILEYLKPGESVSKTLCRLGKHGH